VGFVVDKVALGQVFSEYFGFPCQFSFHRLLHTHRLSSEAGTIGQILADVPSGLKISLTPPQETKKKKKDNVLIVSQFVDWSKGRKFGCSPKVLRHSSAMCHLQMIIVGNTEGRDILTDNVSGPVQTPGHNL
jgi:hypothetical protein